VALIQGFALPEGGYHISQTNYYVIGKTSPVTYQVVGHFKTILILVLGFVAFSQQVNYTNLFGVSVAVVGMILYGEIKRREGAQSSSSAARPPTVAIVSDRVDTTSDRAAAGAKELLPLVRIDSNKPAPPLPSETRANAV